MIDSKLLTIKEKYHAIFASSFFLDNECEGAEKENQKLNSSILKELEEEKTALLLVIGVDDGGLLILLKDWLAESNQRKVIFFDENCQRVVEFIQKKELEEQLIRSQVDVKLVLNEEFERALTEAIIDVPIENISLHLDERYSYLDKEALLSQVARKSVLTISYFHEKAYYHLLLRNLIQNFYQMPKAFCADELTLAFKNIPVIICGAGPSLKNHENSLKKLKGRALIFAGGSAVKALEHMGIEPDIAFALDPNPEEFERLSLNYQIEVPLLFGARVEPRALKSWMGPIGYMKTTAGGFVEQELQEKLDLCSPVLLQGLCEEALSVTTLILSAAASMGCSKIYLCGVDLAFTEGKRYSPGVLEANDQIISTTSSCINRQVLKPSRDGVSTTTSIKWVMELDAIETFAQKHKDIKIYDATSGGLGFPSLEKIDLDSLSYPLIDPLLIDKKINQCQRLSSKKNQIELFIKELYESFESSLKIIEEINAEYEKKGNADESALVTLLELELEDQKAYQWFLKPLQEHEGFLYSCKHEYWKLCLKIISDCINLCFPVGND